MTEPRSRVRALETFGSDLNNALRDYQLSRAQGDRRKRFAIAVAGVVLTAVVVATPPGRALAERLAELAGIGAEPSSSVESPVDSPDTVFGLGEAPNGTGYEVVANADLNLRSDHVEETCVTVEFPAVEGGSRWFSCNTESLSRSIGRDPLHLVARVGPEALGPNRMMVSGLVGPQISRVTIEHRGADGELATYDADVFSLDGDVREAIGATEDLRFALAFLPTALVPPKPEGMYEPVDVDRHPTPLDPSEHPINRALRRFTVVGFDAAGQEVARLVLGDYTWAFMNLYPPPAPSPRAEAYEEAVDACLRELAAERGTPIEPDLSAADITALSACARRRSE